MTSTIIQDLISMQDEPIISDENEELLQTITSISRTSEFELMGLEEEKLDELLSSLQEQENFAVEIADLSEGLERVPSIALIDDEEEEDYI